MSHTVWQKKKNQTKQKQNSFNQHAFTESLCANLPPADPSKPLHSRPRPLLRPQVIPLRLGSLQSTPLLCLCKLQSFANPPTSSLQFAVIITFFCSTPRSSLALPQWESQHCTHSAVYSSLLCACSICIRMQAGTGICYTWVSSPLPVPQLLQSWKTTGHRSAGFTAVPDKLCRLSCGNPFTFLKFTHASFPKNRLGLGDDSSIAPASDLHHRRSQRNSPDHVPQL